MPDTFLAFGVAVRRTIQLLFIVLWAMNNHHKVSQIRVGVHLTAVGPCALRRLSCPLPRPRPPAPLRGRQARRGDREAIGLGSDLCSRRVRPFRTTGAVQWARRRVQPDARAGGDAASSVIPAPAPVTPGAPGRRLGEPGSRAAVSPHWPWTGRRRPPDRWCITAAEGR